MSGRLLTTLSRASARRAVRYFAVAPAAPAEGLPPTLERVGHTSAFPNEYPGQIYAFNWCLNGDGVTPINKAAFRITKPLDLKVAGIPIPKTNPLKVKPAAASKIPEAGSDALSFADFDSASQTIRNSLSLSKALYCPEGHVPGTHTAVRVITNAPAIATEMVAYLERAPKLDPPESLPITVYVLQQEGEEESPFAGYAIEEVEVPLPQPEGPGWVAAEDMGEDLPKIAKSVAAVVVANSKPDLKLVVAGIETSQKALAADELERQAKEQQDSE